MGSRGTERGENQQVGKDHLQGLVYYVKEIYKILSSVGSCVGRVTSSVLAFLEDYFVKRRVKRWKWFELGVSNGGVEKIEWI